MSNIIINNKKYEKIDDIDNSENSDLIFSLIRNSLEYYDEYQPRIQKLLDKIEYIKIINDEYIFYDSDDNIIFKSRIETLSMFTPQNNTWRWSWSVPFAKYNNTLISRKILDYAFTLNTSTDLILKSSLINSKIIITNQYQIDIYLALSSMLSKKPFIFRLYLFPFFDDDDDKKKNNLNNIYYYKKIINHPDKHKYISVYSFIIDWK